MNFRSYLKDKLLYIVLLFFLIFSLQVFFIPFEVAIIVKIYAVIAPIILFVIPLLVEYYSRKNFYNDCLNKLEELDQKYLIAEILEKSNFSESKILCDILQEVDKSMIENVNKYKFLQEDYKEYIELWIHEIKTPISTGKMIIENNKSEITESINEELDKIEDYTEQALYYARSNAVEKDYFVKKLILKELVSSSIIKNKRNLIQNQIKIDTHDLEIEVSTDFKWCAFILNQILQNSIKYSKDNDKQIEIFAKENKDNVVLYIKDNGIGIPKSDVSRVFEKGFTGENGRRSGKKATGIGLYLCKNLCDKLGLLLELDSLENTGTEVKITFPKSSFIREVFN